MSTEKDGCPKCGAPEKEIKKYEGFSGHETLVCNKCGYVLEEK